MRLDGCLNCIALLKWLQCLGKCIVQMDGTLIFFCLFFSCGTTASAVAFGWLSVLFYPKFVPPKLKGSFFVRRPRPPACTTFTSAVVSPRKLVWSQGRAIACCRITVIQFKSRAWFLCATACRIIQLLLLLLFNAFQHPTSSAIPLSRQQVMELIIGLPIWEWVKFFWFKSFFLSVGSDIWMGGGWSGKSVLKRVLCLRGVITRS